MNITEPNAADLNRRDFLRGGSIATLLTMLGAVELKADAPKNAEGKVLSGPKVKCGIIGLGPWGREIIATLQRQPEAEIAALCDPYEPMLNRSAKNAPGAKTSADYQTLLDDKEIKAIIVATPSHQHKEIVLAALQAGKHVYCEAPMATTIEDARTIAKAAHDAVGQVFQVGLNLRSDPQRHFLLQFIRAGAMGKNVMARAQWHKKQSWRFFSPNSEREKEINWRLSQAKSLGLIGEIGIHQMDLISWFLKDLPVAVTGFGGLLHWTDGRDVPDTIQAVFEFPGGVQSIYDATLANSFDGDYEVFYGTDAAVMLRANKAWMFKEVDSPLLGWEVYARKDTFYKETGIALVANATKLVAQGDNPVEDAPYSNTPLSYALEAFLTNTNEVSGAVEDFKETFGTSDKKALEKHLSTIVRQPAAGWKEGLESAVLAIKANEAINSKSRITYQKDWFHLA